MSYKSLVISNANLWVGGRPFGKLLQEHGFVLNFAAQNELNLLYMEYPQLHFTGQIWRPPYEASSQLLQVTSGCTWHKCKFCSLYHGTPFRMSPISEVEDDLRTIKQWQPRARRVYLTGANPFVLSYDKLMDIAVLLRKYLPHLVSFGMFARVTDIAPKSVEELRNLRQMKLDGINIGIETAHDLTLERMNKGYHASDILAQLSKLDEAGIRYNLFYLNGLGGKGTGIESAMATADVINRLHPCIINIVSLTIFQESQLYQEVVDGTYEEEPEVERLIEVRTLIERLKIKVNLLGHHVSNAVPITGALPNDRQLMLKEIDNAIATFPEAELKDYRSRIWYL